MITVFFLFVVYTLANSIFALECIGTPKEFTTHLNEILGDYNTDIIAICPGVRLGTRTQVLDPANANNPDTLNKRGIFWTFATGEDVASEWLQFAKDAKGEKRAFAEKVLHHVGFSDDQIDFSQRFHMVVFDFDLMDGIWVETDGGQESWQSTWWDTFDYLSGGFKVCRNPGAGYPDGDNISDNDDCVDRFVTVSATAQDMIMTKSWSDLTGCPGGYPDHSRMRNYTACMAECDNSQDASTYCKFVDIITPISYGGSIACTDEYERSKPEEAVENEAIWARVWFEKCMGCNPWFTGKGFGYDPNLPGETGTEFYVRGDVDLERLGPASGTDIWP